MTTATLSRWLLAGEWRAHWLQLSVALIAIAIGVAMAYSIHLINTAAFNEFSAASKSLSGQSDLQVHGRSGFFDEMLYPRLAGHDGVQHRIGIADHFRAHREHIIEICRK